MAAANRSFGWSHRPADVQATLAVLAASQGASPLASVSAANLLARADDDKPALLWLAEEKAKGGEQPSWDQGEVGTCVSFGFGRGVNDLMYVQAGGSKLASPDVATEPIYGGSRVEVGGGRISGDGSVGAWAARFVREWGVLFRQPYGRHDLSRYSERLSREWGNRGVPDELEPTCREHPVRTVALVKTPQEAWALLGNGYPIPVCSTVGFETPLTEGFCVPAGNWPHCMLLRGRLLAKYRGSVVKAFVVQNSWADYLQGEPYVVGADGTRVKLPEGCFAITDTWLSYILRDEDSLALSDFVGFEPRELDWLF